jgi:ABC-type glycerol-3-phosphate transport system permease component
VKASPAARTAQYGVLALLLVLSFVPVVMMLVMSLRDSLLIYADFWGAPWPPKFANYSSATLRLAGPALRTVFLCAASVGGILLTGVLASHAFARLSFPGRTPLLFLVVFMMTIPRVLQLTPNFILANWLRLRNTYAGLVLFYVGGGLLFAIFLLNAFFKNLPEELYEAARMEGAGELECIRSITVPLSLPIIITISIMEVLSIYNDLIWPLLMISTPAKHPIAVALQFFTPATTGDNVQFSRPDLGVVTAGYVFASLPLLVLFAAGMKYYVKGLTSGAIKS